jgi:hypothetical protein
MGMEDEVKKGKESGEVDRKERVSVQADYGLTIGVLEFNVNLISLEIDIS